MARSHFFKATAIVAIGVGLTVLYAQSLTNTYQTTAVIQILQPQNFSQIQPNSNNTAVLLRLQAIEQQLLSRNSLTGIIQKYDLFSDNPSIPFTEKIDLLRETVQLIETQNATTAWQPNMRPASLLIRVSNSDPDMAATIANELSRVLLELSRDNTADQTTKALDFFVKEKARVGNEIATLDREISLFKQKNADLLPEGRTSLRNQLTILDATILQIKSEIIPIKGNDQDRKNIITERLLRQLQEQLSLVESKKQFIRSQIDRGPEVERALISLKRNLVQVSEKFSLINKQLAETELRQKLEESKQLSIFKILDRALVPKHRISPNKKKIVILGTGFSLALAIAMIAFLELRNGIVRTASQMDLQLDLAPIVTIPSLRKPNQHKAESDHANLFDNNSPVVSKPNQDKI